MTPGVGLADLLRAVRQLAPLGDDPASIARVLGLAPVEVAARVAATLGAVIAPAAPQPPVVQPPSAPGSAASATAAVTEPSTGSPRTVERGPVVLRALGRPEPEPPAWLPARDEAVDLTPAADAAPAAPETLFEPRRHRALISAALASFDDSGPLDLDRLIEQVATGRLAPNLPRIPELTLRRGVWLLLDRSPAMAPLFDDVGDLAARIERVVGRDATRVQEFMARPDRVWDAATLDDAALALPPPGTPLVAVTDLGLRSRGQGWRPLLLRLAARASRAIAIVPYPAGRVPLELRALATVVPWDRSTTVAAVKPRLRRRQ
jgi:hypothetical protein